jgi:hypothetical protein
MAGSKGRKGRWRSGAAYPLLEERGTRRGESSKAWRGGAVQGGSGVEVIGVMVAAMARLRVLLLLGLMVAVGGILSLDALSSSTLPPLPLLHLAGGGCAKGETPSG